MFESLGKVFPRQSFHLWTIKDLMCSLRPLACDVAEWDCVCTYVPVRTYVYRMVLQSKENWRKGTFHKGFGWTPDSDGVESGCFGPPEMVKFYIDLHRVSRGRNPWSLLGCD